MKKLIAITKALADENRVRLLLALTGRELCVCQLIELLGLAPSTVSKHMSILRQADLVELRKDGRWAWYRAAGKGAPQIARRAIDWLVKAGRSEPAAVKDDARLQRILKCDPEELCKRLNCK